MRRTFVFAVSLAFLPAAAQAYDASTADAVEPAADVADTASYDDVASSAEIDAGADAAIETGSAAGDAIFDQDSASADVAPPTSAGEALQQIVERKLKAADAVCARAKEPGTKRVPLTDFLVLVQRDTCASVFQDLERGHGAECMAAPVASEAHDATEDEDVQVCASHGGVLVKRMQACSEASVYLAQAFENHSHQGDFDAMMGAYTDVARLCWGRTLCVE